MKRKKLKKRPDGRYRLYYHGHQIYGYTQEEVYSNRDAYIAQQKQLQYLAGRLTVQDYSAQWVSTYKQNVAKNSYNDYVRVLKRLCDHNNIGKRMMTDISTIDLQSFANTYNGLSASSIAKLRLTLNGMFQSAIADRIISYNPTMKLKYPTGERGSHRSITDEERELIHAVKHRIRPVVMLMLYAGLRSGEALAIDADRDIDFTNKTITVREALRWETNNKVVIAKPKTTAGKRIIPLLNVLQKQLTGLHGIIAKPSESHKNAQKRALTGKYMTKESWKSAWSSYITALQKYRNGTTQYLYKSDKPFEPVTIRPHDLRHSYATMLRDSGVQMKLAMLWMGHANQTMILRIYDHPSEYRSKLAVESIEKMLETVQKTVQHDSDSVEDR